MMEFGTLFLAEPHANWAAASSSPWGDKQYTIFLNGGPFAFHGLSTKQHSHLKAAFDRQGRPFTLRDSSVSIQLHHAPSEIFTFPDWMTQYYFEIEHANNSVAIAGFKLYATIDLGGDAITCDLWTDEQEDGRVFVEMVVINLLRVLSAYSLLFSGGLLLHCAAIQRLDSALIFSGVSGAGKSTLSKLALATQHNVLSDDINVFFISSGKPHVEKMPFSGELRAAPTTHSKLPVRAFHTLSKGPRNRVTEISRGLAFSHIFANCPFVNKDPIRQEIVWQRIEELFDSVPAYRLEFMPDNSIWELLDKTYR